MVQWCAWHDNIVQIYNRKDADMMATTNLTVRVDEDVRKEFDNFCENVGINATSAINMFIKTVIRTRTLPFIVTDNADRGQHDAIIMAKMKNATQSMRKQSAVNGNENMTMEEIDAEIKAHRSERRNKNA